MIAGIAGGVLALLAGLSLYLATPHQKWGALPCSPATLGRGGLALLALSLALLLSWAGIATALFIAMTVLMITWSSVPIIVAWWRA